MLLLLPGIALFAGGRRDKAVADSLWKCAIEHSKRGRFEKSNSMLTDLLDNHKLSKRDYRNAYRWLARNAKLSRDYQAYCNYTEMAGDEPIVLYSALARLPAQSVERPRYDVSVPYQVDSIFNDTMNYFGGLIRVPVSIGGKLEWMLIDNGAAHFSVVSESFAASHGIRPVGASGHANGSTGERSSFWMGIADSLSIGELKIRNLLFSVVADDSVENPYVDFSTILGANFFRLAGEMRFDNERRHITFPVRYEEKEANLTVNERDRYFADVCVLGDTLRFFLDLGANSTGLDGNYYKLHKHTVRSAYEPVEHIRYGLGGSRTSVEYKVENLAFETCGGLFVKDSARISVKKDEGPDTYGWIGTDFIFNFDTVTLNLEKMYMYVGSPLDLPAAEHEFASQVEDEADG
jgi:hypothetical protein